MSGINGTYPRTAFWNELGNTKPKRIDGIETFINKRKKIEEI